MSEDAVHFFFDVEESITSVLFCTIWSFLNIIFLLKI